MSSKDKWSDWRDTQRKISMSEKAGRKLPFMRETACVHVQEREILAFIEAYPLICPKDKNFIKYLDETVKPVMLKIGRSRWYRDTITDLGFALASTGKGDVKTEDMKNILKVDVEE